MKKIGVFYGSSTGTCEDLANQIADKMGVSQSDVYSADKLTADLVKEYDLLIIGTSTWGDGELQDDWYDGVKVLKAADLSFKSVALFGCGDSESYCDTFCDGMGILYEDLKDSGCSFIGNKVSTDGYSYSSSIAVVDGAFVGLALDEVNESDKTAERIDAWTAELKSKI
ncbi:flavodoxin FldA [Bacteroides gallinarum]|jgi:flavodoxin|uniref:flavodoxin FldA n=1 Tax=Bacteroides gallinarum TaxID=376806 RepID=UPI000376D7DE|nr:flavodoxin FldA [Bacteroides gallinarum]